MDKKLHEDLNRIRKLSGLVEDDRTWTERLPDGTVRTHRYGYSDEKPGIPAWDSYKDKRVWGQGSTSPSPGAGTGSGEQGSGRAAGTPGNGQGAGQQGNGPGMGTSNGLGGRGNGPGQGNGGEIQRIPSGGNSVGSPGVGSGKTIQRITPSNGDTGYSDGRTSGQTTTTYSPGYSTSTYPDDSDIEKPLSPRELARQRAAEREAEREAEAEQRRQDRLDRAQQTQKVTNPPNTGYVNPAWEKEQERLKKEKEQERLKKEKEQQQTPPKPTPAQDLILKNPNSDKPMTFPVAKPTAPVKKPEELPTLKAPEQPKITFPTAKPTEPVKKPADDLPVLKAPDQPKITFPVAKAEPEKKKPADDLPILKGPEQPKITFPVAKPDKPKKPEPEPTPAPEPIAAPSNKEQPDVKVDAKTGDNKAGDNIVIPPVLTTKEPSTWDVPTPGEYKPGTSKPIASPEKPPSVAQQILLPKDDTADVELLPMSQADQDKAFGPMPGNSSSSAAKAKPGSPGQASAGSGSAGQSASGATGDSGEKGGAKSSSDPWARPLVQKPWETPKGKFQDPGMIGAPDFKGTLTNPGKLPNSVPGMPDTDLTGNAPTTLTPAPANNDAKPLTITRGTSKPNSVEAQDRAAEMQRVSDEMEKSLNKPNEGMERMLQLAGIKESTRVERQFLQESKVTKTNTITDTFKRLAGLK
jgi:hypothetical protein